MTMKRMKAEMINNIMNGEVETFPVLITEEERDTNSELLFVYKILGIDDRLINLSSHMIPLWKEDVDEEKLISILIKYRNDSIVEKFVSVMNLYTDSIIELVESSNNKVVDLFDIISQITMTYVCISTEDELVEIIKLLI